MLLVLGDTVTITSLNYLLLKLNYTKLEVFVFNLGCNVDINRSIQVFLYYSERPPHKIVIYINQRLSLL